MIKKLALIVVSLQLSLQAEMFSVETKAAMAGVDLVTKKGALNYVQFKKAWDECVTTYKTFYDGASAGDKTTQQGITGNYLLCTAGDNSVLATLPAAFSKAEPIGICKYAQNSVDVSNQITFHKAIRKCFSYDKDLFNGVPRGTCEIAASVVAEVVTFKSCINEAIKYTKPYTERQFQICEEKCTAANTPNLTEMDTCVYEAEACAKFKILSSGDATNPSYAKHFAACYDDNCYSKLTATAFVTCMKTCDRPDYSDGTFTSSLVLSSSMIVLLLVNIFLF